jgi:hypothetical protein
MPSFTGRKPRTRIHALVAVALLLFASPATRVHAAGSAPRIAANPADFQQVQLALGRAEMGEPMSLAVLPDRRCCTPPATAPSA